MNKKILLSWLTAIVLLFTQVVSAQCTAPIVNNFNPSTGYIGSTVTINGAHFDPIPSNNRVYFGAVEANVLTASFGKLTVQVPVGANTALISVKNGCDKIAYSSVPFNGIFCPTPLDNTTYQNVSFNLGNIVGAYNMMAQDMDGDGKPDVISEGFGSNLTIAKNNSTPGNLNFSSIFVSSPGPRSIAAADFDGDGKFDLLTNGYVHRNLSTHGNIAVSGPIYIGNVGYQCAVGDVNNDGKIDAISGNGGNILVFLNTSSGPGSISFNGSLLL